MVVKDVPVAAPMFGVISVGVFASTGAPVPVYATHVGVPIPVDNSPAFATVVSPLMIPVVDV